MALGRQDPQTALEFSGEGKAISVFVMGPANAERRFANTSGAATGRAGQAVMQHFLYFLPDPQGQGSLRPIFGLERTNGAIGRWI